MYNKILIVILVIVSVVFLFTYAPMQVIKEGFNAKKNYLDGVDVIYWINLDRSTDRRQRMEAMFQDPVFKNVPIIRIRAVDGKAPNIDKILNANFEGMQPDRFTKVEYACTLSHINAIREFSKTNYKTALIMEDDMTLEYKPYWKKSVKQIMNNAPSDWEIIQLCINIHAPLKKLYTKNNGYIYCSGSYIITKPGSNKIINIKSQPNVAEDYIYSNTNTYAYKYPMFTYNFNENSTIHPNHIDQHNNNKKIIDKFIKSFNSNIPLNIYQTWHTNKLPPKMRECVNKLKSDNPKFNHQLYDLKMCRNFIKNNFNSRVLKAYDSLKPLAFKADLWRYCVLYINGGIYLDIKYKCEPGFKLIDIANQDVYVKEYWNHAYLDNAVYNGFIISAPNNIKLINIINQICENVKTKYYDKYLSGQTGPYLFGRYFDKNEIHDLEYTYYEINKQGFIKHIKTNKNILSFYPEYREEQKKYSNNNYWQDMWKNKDIYK